MKVGQAVKVKKSQSWWVWALCGVFGFLIGGGSAFAVSRGALGDDSFVHQGWSTNLTVGSEAANPWVRARIAMVGLLALNKSETVYFDRSTDQDGQPLQANCTYELAGQGLPARWWSITLYDQDNMLARNTDQAASLDATRLGTLAWDAIISPKQPADTDAHWISSKGAGTFSLTLRLYNPEGVSQVALSEVSMPAVIPLYCGQGEE